MQPYHHFTPEERESLQILHAMGKSMRKIAVHLHRSPSSISRELRRGRSEPGHYSAHIATQGYENRRKHCKQGHCANKNPVFVQWLEEKLAMRWSVEAIVGRFKLEHPTVYCPSVCSIYRGFHKGFLPRSLQKKLKYRGRKPGAYRTSKNGKLQVEHTIHDRPACVALRERFGDWESDTLFGYKQKSALATHVERKSRYLVVAWLPNTGATAFTNATVTAFAHIPCPVHTMTVDRGMEFSKWRELEAGCATTVYFCDPRSPWQRGSNENTNGILRQYFPKGFDFNTITHLQLQQVVAHINHRPRKCLAFRSPFEVFFDCCTSLDIAANPFTRGS